MISLNQISKDNSRYGQISPALNKSSGDQGSYYAEKGQAQKHYSAREITELLNQQKG